MSKGKARPTIGEIFPDTLPAGDPAAITVRTYVNCIFKDAFISSGKWRPGDGDLEEIRDALESLILEAQHAKDRCQLVIEDQPLNS